MKVLFNSYFMPHLVVHIKLLVYILLCCNEKDLCYIIKSKFSFWSYVFAAAVILMLS